MTKDRMELETVKLPDFETETLWTKVKEVAKKAGREVIGTALTLYYCLMDEDTPPWAKATIIGALIYFISPVDAVPDIIPGVGYSDDLIVLAGAVATVAAHIKPAHRQRATEWVDNAFGSGD